MMKDANGAGAKRPRTRPRARRTQEERSAATRTKVVLAATECVAELGFRGATMSAIAARAGVTWGAMQHQFGDKDAILDAVLETVITDFETHLSGLREAEPEPRARVRAFMRRCQQLLHRPGYRALFEIQSNRSREDDAYGRDWAHHVETVLRRLWRSLFGDLGVPRAQLAAARRFTFVVLSGIASERMLFPETDFSRKHLELLEETLLRRLGLAA
ncbi:MAG: TetR/AcrR family transcriptional regulator [Proteobacteria bacterium]|nr:TetR/AcrR family transcriptional regulator [Pseudomonadota bacterium]